MEDEKGGTLQRLGYIAIAFVVVGWVFGTIFYNLVLLPIKYLYWASDERRTHPENMLKPYLGYYHVWYGLSIGLGLVWYFCAFHCGEDWNFLCHMFAFFVWSFPTAVALGGIKAEFEGLTEQVGETYTNNLSVMLATAGRVVIGVAFLVAVGYLLLFEMPKITEDMNRIVYK